MDGPTAIFQLSSRLRQGPYATNVKPLASSFSVPLPASNAPVKFSGDAPTAECPPSAASVSAGRGFSPLTASSRRRSSPEASNDLCLASNHRSSPEGGGSGAEFPAPTKSARSLPSHGLRRRSNVSAVSVSFADGHIDIVSPNSAVAPGNLGASLGGRISASSRSASPDADSAVAETRTKAPVGAVRETKEFHDDHGNNPLRIALRGKERVVAEDADETLVDSAPESPFESASGSARTTPRYPAVVGDSIDFSRPGLRGISQDSTAGFDDAPGVSVIHKNPVLSLMHHHGVAMLTDEDLTVIGDHGRAHDTLGLLAPSPGTNSEAVLGSKAISPMTPERPLQSPAEIFATSTRSAAARGTTEQASLGTSPSRPGAIPAAPYAHQFPPDHFVHHNSPSLELYGDKMQALAAMLRDEVQKAAAAAVAEAKLSGLEALQAQHRHQQNRRLSALALGHTDAQLREQLSVALHALKAQIRAALAARDEGSPSAAATQHPPHRSSRDATGAPTRDLRSRDSSERPRTLPPHRGGTGNGNSMRQSVSLRRDSTLRTSFRRSPKESPTNKRLQSASPQNEQRFASWDDLYNTSANARRREKQQEQERDRDKDRNGNFARDSNDISPSPGSGAVRRSSSALRRLSDAITASHQFEPNSGRTASPRDLVTSVNSADGGPLLSLESPKGRPGARKATVTTAAQKPVVKVVKAYDDSPVAYRKPARQSPATTTTAGNRATATPQRQSQRSLYSSMISASGGSFRHRPDITRSSGSIITESSFGSVMTSATASPPQSGTKNDAKATLVLGAKNKGTSGGKARASSVISESIRSAAWSSTSRSRSSSSSSSSSPPRASARFMPPVKKVAVKGPVIIAKRR